MYNQKICTELKHCFNAMFGKGCQENRMIRGIGFLSAPIREGLENG